jgi:hypothetical protein
MGEYSPGFLDLSYKKDARRPSMVEQIRQLSNFRKLCTVSVPNHQSRKDHDTYLLLKSRCQKRDHPAEIKGRDNRNSTVKTAGDAGRLSQQILPLPGLRGVSISSNSEERHNITGQRKQPDLSRGCA